MNNSEKKLEVEVRYHTLIDTISRPESTQRHILDLTTIFAVIVPDWPGGPRPMEKDELQKVLNSLKAQKSTPS